MGIRPLPVVTGRGFLSARIDAMAQQHQPRAIVFFDGQNLFRVAKNAWEHHGPPYGWPCFDVVKLAQALVDRLGGRQLSQIRFYTGAPTSRQNEFWSRFWRNKLYVLEQQGVYVYRGRISNAQEKGVDVSIATDLLWLTYKQQLDMAIIVSQDSDLAPAVVRAKEFAKDQGRWVTFESAFPEAPHRSIGGPKAHRGIDGTDWVVIDKATYDACIDPRDYR